MNSPYSRSAKIIGLDQDKVRETVLEYFREYGVSVFSTRGDDEYVSSQFMPILWPARRNYFWYVFGRVKFKVSPQSDCVHLAVTVYPIALAFFWMFALLLLYVGPEESYRMTSPAQLLVPGSLTAMVFLAMSMLLSHQMLTDLYRRFHICGADVDREETL